MAAQREHRAVTLLSLKSSGPWPPSPQLLLSPLGGGDRRVRMLLVQVEALEVLCHRYLKQPDDGLTRNSLIEGLEVVCRIAVDEGAPAVVRGLMAQCQAYANLLHDDLQQVERCHRQRRTAVSQAR